MNLVVNGRLEYWTLQKLLTPANIPAAVTTVVAPEVTAAQLAALQAQVTLLQNEITILKNIINKAKGVSLIQNQQTGLMHRMLYLPDSAENIIVDRNPFVS